MDHLDPGSEAGSRAASPGHPWREINKTKVVQVNGRTGINGVERVATEDDKTVDSEPFTRYRPRTFPYQKYLPYPHDDHALENLDQYVQNLYIAVSAGDFVPGATHWTREIRGWLQLKFDMPRSVRIKLTKLYYELALAPGVEHNAADRFQSMFLTLTKRKHYLRAGDDLYLDWRPLFRELKTNVLPSDHSTSFGVASSNSRKSPRSLVKMSGFAQLYFDARDIPDMLEELLPFFNTSSTVDAFAVVGLLNVLLPSTPPSSESEWQPQHYFPTLFHLWSTINRSKTFDLQFLDLFSRYARDSVASAHVPFSEFGIFTSEQASTIFTAVLRLLEIPVSQVTSPYSVGVDLHQGIAVLLDRDRRKHPFTHHIARWIVSSLSPTAAKSENSMLTKLEGLIQAIETFFHPSNTGHWTKTLTQLVFHLTESFLLRWNKEHSGEIDMPESRKLDDEVKRRFVLCLRDVTFMGIFSKSRSSMAQAQASLSTLSFLEPQLILPGALQRIYPSMRGSVEVHRTTSALQALHGLTRIMVKTKGFRCHVTSLLGLALPGIDANDLDKTMHTLTFMQDVFYYIPMWNMSKSRKEDEEGIDGMVAAQWVTNQIERFEVDGVDVAVNYDEELSDEDEALILRSSTADFKTFLLSFLERVFNLLRNLPDASKIRSGTPEESITNALPAMFAPLLSSMEDDLYEMALQKIAEFVTKHTVYQAKDAMSFICSCLCKVNPQKALNVLIPILSRNIRSEIDDNGAGSTRTVGADVLPRDKALVWNIGILSMVLVHSGSALADFEEQLLDIINYMLTKCRGIPATHASNMVHHVLLTLTVTYTVDTSLFEEEDLKNGVTPDLWGKLPDPQNLNIKWHYPDQGEINFAVKLLQKFTDEEVGKLDALTSDNPPVKRDGTAKEWSDEVSRSLVLLRLVVSGASALFDPRIDLLGKHDPNNASGGQSMDVDSADGMEAADYNATEDEDVKPTYQYDVGNQLKPGDGKYELVHELRNKIGKTLHSVHKFLTEKQQDDVTSFNSLYTAYRSWFTDVGIERSAHVLDRVMRLLASDQAPFKYSGLRKEYPRPILVRRASLYHLQRLRHNSSPRLRTELDAELLHDLVQSSVSPYTEIRKTAQTAIEATMKVLIGARRIVIPLFLDHFQKAIDANDFAKIKGSMYSLLFGSLTRPVGRDWNFTPSLMKSFVNVMDVDKPSVQKVAGAATLQILDMTLQSSRLAIVDQELVEDLVGSSVASQPSVQSTITQRRQVIASRYDFIKNERKKLADELANIAERSHWKKESRTATIVIGLSLRFDDITSEQMVDLVVKRSVDSHPSLRSIYGRGLLGLFAYIDMRAAADHSYENLLIDRKKLTALAKSKPDREDADFTKKFLESFAQPHAETYVDHDYPGWLVWGREFPAFAANVAGSLEYDEVEQKVRNRIGSWLDREWFSATFNFMKQEPRDANSDRFRITNVIVLQSAFNLVFNGAAKSTFEDIKALTKEVFGDGSDRHEHRVTSEILAALVNAAPALKPERRTEIWTYVFPILKDIFEDGLTPENSQYWTAFLDCALQNKDPRRTWPLVQWLANFRLDMQSNAAFKESSKISLLDHCILNLGWHFQLDEPIKEDFVAHLDHPYKGVREVMGTTLSLLNRTRYHESYRDVPTLLKAQRESSSIGQKPYEIDEEFTDKMNGIFARIETWRQERTPGQQTASSYTSGSKTLLAWLEGTLASYECTQLTPLFPDLFLEPFLHMMDIKEDPELQSHAYLVFRHLGNVPLRAGEETNLVNAMMRIGQHAESWHQRLRIMINIQAVYFRLLFIMPHDRQLELFNCISNMLKDSQLEVRVGAGTTLSGMIRCSPISLRQNVIDKLIKDFTGMLRKNPVPKRTGTTATPENNKAIMNRHAAVLGLGGLVQAFPYTSPPPTWIPGVLATLATKAAGDPGIVGKSAKSIVSDFKKTRQDTWHIDKKAFKEEELEDLEGVLWKSYFA